MAKKNKSAQPSRSAIGNKFDVEKSALFAPVAFALIFVILLLLFSGFIFSDKMLYGSDMIQAGIFFRSLLVDSVFDNGAIPQWNPYIFGGMPYVEAFHGDIFYPLSALKYIGKLYWMLGFNLFLHIFLAGIFMYLAARQFRLNKIAAMLSAVCYMFAPYLISLVAPGHDGKIFVTALFPLVIFFLDRGFDKSLLKAFFNFTMLGLVIGVIILSPHLQMSYFTLWAVALYALFKLIFIVKESNIATAIRPAALTTYAVILGLLLSAIQFYPGYLYTTNFSPRADSKQGWEWATSWSMHEEEAFSLLIPEFAGVSSQDVKTYYWGKNAFKDNSEAVGTVSIFMALIGFFFYRRRESYFFGGLALFALFYALGATTPLFRLFFYLIPKVQALRAPSMIMFLFSFSSALLAGMGLSYVMSRYREAEENTKKKFNYVLLGGPSLMLFLALAFTMSGRSMLSAWASIFYSDAATLMVQRGVSKLDLAYLNLPQIQGGAWMAFLVLASASCLLWLFTRGKIGRTILIGLLLLPVLNGCRFNSRFISTTDPLQHWGTNPVVDYIKSRPGRFRVENFRVLPADLLPYHKVEVVTGYHGNQLRWYDQILGGPALTNQANPRFLNLSGAKYLIFPSSVTLPGNYFGPKPVSSAYNFGGGNVFQNNNAFPRLFLVNEYKVFDDRDRIVDEVLSGSDDMRRLVYLEEEPTLEINADSLATDSCWIIDHQADSILIGLDVSTNQIMILTENYFDAWNVTVDGLGAKQLRAYGTFRAVEVPAGTKQVLFKYKSKRYQTGRMITWLTGIYLLIIVVGYPVIRRRNGLIKE